MSTKSLNINRTEFKQIILENQEKKGNEAYIVHRIQAELNKSTNTYFYDSFLQICNKYGIKMEDKKEEATIQLTLKGAKKHSISYTKEDITDELANTLYDLLGKQIKTDLFIEKIRSLH